MTALSTINAVGRWGTFFVYAAMNVLCVVFVVCKRLYGPPAVRGPV